MAIVQNGIVSPKIPPDVAKVVQGPLFGIVESAAAPWTVLWSNGQRVTAIVEANLVLITAADSALRNSLVGRLVKITSPTGQTNFGQGVCVDVYKRDADSYALVQNQATGFYAEWLASAVEAV